MSRLIPFAFAAAVGLLPPASTVAIGLACAVPSARSCVEVPLGPQGSRSGGLLHRTQHAPDQHRRVDQALSGLTGEKSGGPQTHLLKVAIDLAPGVRIRVGELLTLRIQSPIAGNLVVLNQEADGRTTQLYPNALSGGPSTAQLASRIEAGQTVLLPAPGDRFQLRVTPPSGPNRVIAIVVPADVPIADIVARSPNLNPIDDPAKLIEDLTQRTRSTRGVAVEAISRAIGVLEWLVLP